MDDCGRSPVKLLFINTRSSVGADVAVHLQLIENFTAEQCKVFITSNTQASDYSKTMTRLRRVRDCIVIPMNLGYEISGKGRLTKLLNALRNIVVLVIAVIRLSVFVKRNGIEVLHSTDRPRDALVLLWLRRLSGAKAVVHVHIKWYPQIGAITQRALESADCVLAISQFVRRSLEEGGVSPQKIAVAYNSTDTSKFDPARFRRGAFRESLGIDSTIPLIGIVARIMFWKGHVELIEALAELRKRIPNVRLAIVGSDDSRASSGRESYRDRIRQRARELRVEDAIHWVGWRDDMPQVFLDLDVVCVPSWEEPFGLVVTEAMAMERVVVGFQSGALPEIIEDGVDGYLVPFKEIAEMADRIAFLLENKAVAREMGRKARKKVQTNFNPSMQAAEITRIYRNMLAQKPMMEIESRSV
jgi:glycosyltransferase involved in cell wall biosynthesis